MQQNPLQAAEASARGPRIEERKDPNTGHVYFVDMDAGRTAWTREALEEHHEKEKGTKEGAEQAAEEEAGGVQADATRAAGKQPERQGSGLQLSEI